MDKLPHDKLIVGWHYLSFPKLQRIDKQFHPTLYNGCDYSSILELKLTHVSNIRLVSKG